MHGTTLAGPQRRSRAAGRCRTRTLENWLPWNRASWRRPALRRRLQTRWLLRRSQVDRPGAGLRHDHAPHRSARPGRRSGRRSRLGRMCLGRRRSFCKRRSHRLWGCSRSCRPYRWWWRHHNFGRRRRHWRGFLRRLDRRRSLRRRRRGGRNNWRCNHRTMHRRRGWKNRGSRGLGRNRRRRRRCRGNRTWRHSCSRARRCFLRMCCRTRGCRVRSLLDRLQHVTGLGNVGEIELRLDLLGARPARTRLLRRRSFPVSGKVLPHLLRFVRFDGTGVGLLLGDAKGGQELEDFLALDFQLPGQIVDSNLRLHPPCLSPNFR